MLEPQDRSHLIETLRPPEEYELDYAIGTTFSLDLLTLLTVPLAFTGFDWEDEEGRPAPEPMALLESVRRCASRINIFCQAGHIQIPSTHHKLYSYIEDSVFEVNPPDGQGIFHAKVWVLRFVGAGESVRYRLLCLSRNLTFDRSWDTVLALEGELVDRKNAYAANHPLGDFVATLPGMAIRTVPNETRSRIQQMERELRKVSFDLPEDFEGVRFWPLGIDNYRKSPFEERVDRIVVVSPFLDEGWLKLLTEGAEGDILISRPESLSVINADCLKRFKNVYCLAPEAEAPNEEGEEKPQGVDTPLEGLHAKLYVVDAGWNGSVLTGSANATTAAFEHNVEFLVELVGKKSRVGVDASLRQEKGRTLFADLLQSFTPPDEPAKAEDRQLERLADAARKRLATARLVASVKPIPGEETFEIELQADDSRAISFSPGITAKCWPISLPEGLAQPFNQKSGPLVKFGPVSFDALTTFFCFELTVLRGDKRASFRFVLNLPLRGAPSDRPDRILRSLVNNRDQFQKFLLFILAENDPEAGCLLRDLRKAPTEKGPVGYHTEGHALFEYLMRALKHDPAKIQWVANLVKDLEKSPNAGQILPPGFNAIWEPVRLAWERLNHE